MKNNCLFFLVSMLITGHISASSTWFVRKIELYCTPWYISQEEKEQMMRDAAALGDVSVMQRLVDLRVSVNGTDEQLITPLMNAAQFGGFESVQFLVNNGALLDEQDSEHRTALYKAAAANQCAITQLLLDHGASAKLATDFDITPLMAVINNLRHGWSQDVILPVLLRHDAAINHRDRKGRTALYLHLYFNYGVMASRDFEDILIALLKHGADASIETNEKISTLHYARDVKCDQLLDYCAQEAERQIGQEYLERLAQRGIKSDLTKRKMHHTVLGLMSREMGEELRFGTGNKLVKEKIE